MLKMVSGGGCPFAETVQVVDQYCNYFHKPADGAFGEALVSQLSPAFQLDGLYGLDEFEFRLNSANGGLNYVSNDGLMTVESGTTSGAFSTLRSLRSVRYRPGQGSMCRITAMFPTGFTEGYQQVAGFINQSDILGVGYNFGDPSEPLSKRDEFAIVRRQNSKGEVAQFTIDVAASGAETVTITLNNVAFPVSVTAGTTEENTAQLGNDSYTGWIVDYYGSELFFTFDGPPTDLTGTFSISSTGTLSGTYTNLQNGSPPNDNWTYQSDFNIDKLDGSGPSSMSIDPSKLNVFVIDFRWLGAGRIRYSIEDPATGCIFPFHMDYYANQNTIPSISNPSLRIGYGVANAAPAIGTGENVIVQGASMMGAIEGQVIRNTTTKSISESAEYNPSIAADVEHCFLTLKNNRVAVPGKPNVLNQRELIINSVSVAIKDNGSSGDSLRILLYKNAETADVKTYELLDTLMSYSTTRTTMNPGQEGKRIASYAISSNSDLTLDVTPLRIILAPLETLSVVMLSVNTINSQSIGINFEVE
jgi:hypothetical protein